ncbi:hypothetical protein GCM10009117_00500 [Gangjinia marincola]|uniref:DUF4174 domain-containing protein n=2 Tax=Gangjinia marincola TaxID=578463 RepID=A0ABP3XNM1_9FLAO
MRVSAQLIERHQWKDRLVLIISNKKNSEEYSRQLGELTINAEGLDERKLMVYQILPDRHKILQDQDWMMSNDLYKRYAFNDKDFKVILIGLDGSIKVSQDTLLTAKELFATIDQMPMRRATMRRKSKG